MSTNSKPSILLIHGAFHTSAHFVALRALLEGAGYPTYCPTLPFIDGLPPHGLSDTAQFVKGELTRLVDHEERDVIVVAHSYGGLVITQAVDASFSKQVRQASGKGGGVIHLFYMTALIVPVGETACSALRWGPTIPAFLPTNERGQLLPMPGSGAAFYNDLAPEEQAKWVKELKPMSSTCATTPVTFAAHVHYPVSYLFCEADQMIPLALQKELVRTVMETCGTQVRTTTCSAAHSPFLSQPDVVLRVVNEIATSA